MDFQWEWEKIDTFGSLRERDCFVAWMRGQIAERLADEIEAPSDAPGERWFRHIPTGSVWRLVSDENPLGPGFWPAYEKVAHARGTLP
jgi:adenylate cyclase